VSRVERLHALAARRFWPLVGVVTAVGLALRLLFVALVTVHDKVVGDQVFYSAQALTNVGGRWFEQPFAAGMPAADHPPMTALLLTPITWVTQHGSFITAQRVFTALVGTLAIALMAVFGRMLRGPLTGVVAAAILALYANVWVNDGLILSEPHMVVFMVLTLIAGLRVVRAPTLGNAALLGALVGLLALTRSELLLLVAVLVVPLLLIGHAGDRRAALGQAALAIGACIVVIAPWVTWNQTRFAAPVTLSTQDGLSLAGANCAETYSWSNLGGYSLRCALAVPVDPASDPSERSEVMRRAGLRYKGDHLSRLPAVEGARVVRLWSLGWVGQIANEGVAEGRPAWATYLGDLQFWILAPLAVIGARRLRRGERWLLLAVPVCVTLVVLLFNYQWRVRVAAEPSIVALAAVALTTSRRAAESGQVQLSQAVGEGS
jgi:4-amino-4-deoxy-L-arabinose transferase-like glycosyltransferase